MDIFTIDFETYYSREYSLSRMSTEDYVMSDLFEIIMIGIKKNDGPTEVIRGGDLAQLSLQLQSRGVHRGAVLCHNTMFDGLILTARLNIHPRLWLDTLCMAQALLKPFHRSISLGKCLEHRNSPLSKGTAVHNMIGRRLHSLTDSEYREYAQYCSDDVEGEYWLFQNMKALLPKDEYLVIDMTLRMYLEPRFELDPDILTGVLNDEREKKRKLLAALPAHIDKTTLSSNQKFAALLEKLDVEVPLKISPTTLLPTYAFSKTDPEWKDLEDEYADDPIVSAILAARLGIKSTIGETRAQRFLDISLNYGRLRVPLRYYGAHTGRYSGMEKINCQNLPRIPKNTTAQNHLRFAVRAPKGHVVLAVDLSQIEARLNAWLSGCNSLLQVFRDKGDPYCAFASHVFHRPITKADENERFIGKTCILGLGYGMGYRKLRSTLRKDGYKVAPDVAAKYVYTYRDVYKEIPDLWHMCDEIILQMAAGDAFQLIGPVMATKNQLTLPNGMAIHYHDLKYTDSKKYKGWTFSFAGRRKMLWGGTMVENMVQALARITVMEHMLQARKELALSPALQAHDELVYVVPEKELDWYRDEVLRIMKTPPSFAPDLPIDAEAGAGYTYGDAK